MTPLPLDQVGFGWRSHRSALWWLGLLYRKPDRFRKALRELSWSQRFRRELALYLHALPYGFLVCAIGRLIVFGLLDRPTTAVSWRFFENPWVQLVAITASLGFGLAMGLTLGLTNWVGSVLSAEARDELAYGIATGIMGGILLGHSNLLGIPLALAIAYGIGAGLSQSKVEVKIGSTLLFHGIIDIPLVIIAAWFFCGFLGGLFIALAYLSAFLIAWSRIYYEPFQVFFIFPKPRAQWYPCHPVVWDEVCLLPFPGLDRLLSAYAEHAPEAAAVEIDRLILTYPTQRTAALRAQVRLLARQAAGETDLARLALILTRLPEGEKGFLAQTHRVYELVAEISREQILLSTLERPPLRALRAELLFTKIESFRSKVRGFAEPLASEFRAAAAQWLKVAEHQLNEARARSSREPTPQVFRAGDPVDREQEAFVPRDSVVGELEQQITLSTGCPGLILYGRRRMGKSTALRDLARFPPESVDVALVSMEDPAAFTSLGHFLGRLAEAIRNVRPDAWPESAVPAPGETWDLPAFYRLLGASNERFARLGRRLLLAVEEYEGIDAKIGGGVFPRDLLPMIRESIQSHRRLTWLFAGSHAIGELSCADWPNYLISARTVEVPPFTPSETRLLLTDPLKYSPLYAGNDSGRPRFDAAFWGEGGVERIHAEAGGWPHLVQLIAETVVDLLNQEGARAVTPDLFQRALGKAVQRGDAVLRQLVQRECRLPGEWEYLSTFRRRDTQPPPDDDAIYRSLRRRLLIAEENGDWRLRVPLMQRWLREHV